jgi:ribosome-binding protein aMBF1 (putative translation factor)
MPRNALHDPELEPRAREGKRAEASGRLALRHSIARLVLAARAKLSWSQAELARHAATTQARISDIENGRGNLRLDTLERVADALGLALTVRVLAPARRERRVAGAAAV